MPQGGTIYLTAADGTDLGTIVEQPMLKVRLGNRRGMGKPLGEAEAAFFAGRER